MVSKWRRNEVMKVSGSDAWWACNTFIILFQYFHKWYNSKWNRKREKWEVKMEEKGEENEEICNKK